jgi:hypothetical protein
MWQRLQQVMDECEGLVFSFRDFLVMVDGLRADAKGILRSSIHGLFKSYNLNISDAHGVIPSEVPDLMRELPICKDCCQSDPDLLMNFVEAFDPDGGSELNLDALLVLIQKTSEKFRSGQRVSEAATARKLGFSTRQVLQLRESWAELSDTGVIGVPEIRKWFKEINPKVDPSNKELEMLIVEVSPHPMHQMPENDGFSWKDRHDSIDDGRFLFEDIGQHAFIDEGLRGKSGLLFPQPNFVGKIDTNIVLGHIRDPAEEAKKAWHTAKTELSVVAAFSEKSEHTISEPAVALLGIDEDDTPQEVSKEIQEEDASQPSVLREDSPSRKDALTGLMLSFEGFIRVCAMIMKA